MTEITFKDKEKVSRYVTEAISLFNPGSTALSAVNAIKFERIVYILGDLISIQGFQENNRQKRLIIRLALGRYSTNETKTMETLSNALLVEAHQGRDQPRSEFFVVFPLNISFDTLKAKRYFCIDKTRLNIRSFAYVAKKFDFKEPCELLHDSEKGRIEGNFYDFTYIITKVKAKNSNEAFWTTYRRVSLFRSLCTFQLSYGVFRIMGSPSCLGKISPPKYMFVFNEERKFVEHWFTAGEFHQRLLELKPIELQAIEKTIKSYEKLNRGRLKNIFTNCLTLYGYAHDQIELGYIFLHMWQILELIALKDQSGITIDKVKNRIKAIFRSSSIVSDVLDVIFKKRNYLVHEGQLADFSLEDVNQIKMLAEGSMNFLFSHINRLKSVKALQTLYDNIEKSPHEINDKIALLKYAKKLKMA